MFCPGGPRLRVTPWTRTRCSRPSKSGTPRQATGGVDEPDHRRAALPRSTVYTPVATGIGRLMTERRSGRDRDWTDTESEGLPATEEQPPGIDAETAVEGMPLPADHPVAVDEVGVTEREQEIAETVEERSGRERPDVPQAPPTDPTGRVATGATDPDDPLEGDWEEDATGLSAEEAAVHLDEQ